MSVLFLQFQLALLYFGVVSQGCSYGTDFKVHPNFMLAVLAPQNETVCGDGGHKQKYGHRGSRDDHAQSKTVRHREKAAVAKARA